MTAIRSTSIVAVRSMVDGAICAFHQTKRIPAHRRHETRQPEREQAVQRDAVAERAHPHRVVADPEGRARTECATYRSPAYTSAATSRVAK